MKKVYVCISPSVHFNDVRYHVYANCWAFVKASDSHKLAVPRKQAEERYRFCRICKKKEQEDVKAKQKHN